MAVTYKHWQALLLLGLGLALGAGFCMKWIETDLLTGQGRFTILGLELFYSKEEITSLLSSLDIQVKTILQYHFYFDFAFMAGIYPAILSFGMMVKEKPVNAHFKKAVTAMAFLQVIAWIADILENYFLLTWTETSEIGRWFAFFHFIVLVKWVIALSGIALFTFLFLKKS